MLTRYIKARRLARHGVERPLLVLSEAKRANLKPEYALAMLENETGIPQRNVFGCDAGPRSTVPYCGQEVTRERVQLLLASGYSNGVGWTQLTYRPLVFEADAIGGAHLPKYQMRIGFRTLANHMLVYGVWGGFRAYNGSGPAAEAYANQAIDRAKRWKRILE